MNQITPPPKIEIIPSERAVLRSAALLAERLLCRVAVAMRRRRCRRSRARPCMQRPRGDGDDGEAPWHDQTMPIADRMKLAEGRPLRRRMMAAMAQQDCGQCGYDCHDYSEAIASKSEARLNLCVPGGKETARMLKSLYEEIDKAPAAPSSAPAAAPASGACGRRPSPGVRATIRSPAKFVSRRLLEQGRIGKETWHIDFDLSRLRPRLCRRRFLRHFRPQRSRPWSTRSSPCSGASHTTEVRGKTLARGPARRRLAGAGAGFAVRTDLLSHRRRAAREGAALAQGEDPDGDAATLDVMAVLQKFSNVRPHPEAFVEALEPLQPRLYSISSSHNATPGKLSLTVDCVRYVINKRKRLGLASTFLAERIKPGDEVKVYVQKAHGFALPQDPKTPIIMIGPGTGIAPFRAFLHDRRATGAPGKNWLFFGHQRSDCDFFYADELNAMKTSGLLTRLSLAWSRDGDKKFYVQDRMREVGREIVDLACRGRQHLHLRRRQADGQGRRARAGRYRRPVRRPHDRRGRQLRRRNSRRRAGSSRTFTESRVPI